MFALKEAAWPKMEASLKGIDLKKAQKEVVMNCQQAEFLSNYVLSPVPL